MSVDLQRVILSFPTLVGKIDLKAAATPGGAATYRSWNQMAKTGDFVSTRYGEFSITREDLANMLRVFREVMPKAPTQLPMDYDHLSMDPKKPGDGIAAGWIQDLELRASGDELWAEVDWTEKAAKAIEAGEYRFVSPSFAKDYTDKVTGKKIGTTLLAAAITNHPFLDGMAALTLYNFSAIGDLAIAAAVDPTKVTSLAEVGQRVMIAPGEIHDQNQAGQTFEIVEIVGEGDDAFVSVKGADGVTHKWFRSTELLPATNADADPAVKPLPDAPNPAAAVATPSDTPPAPAAAPGNKNVDNPTKTTDNGDSALTAALAQLKKLLGLSDEKGNAMKFMLKNDSGQEIELTTEQLAAAGIKVLEPGQQAISVAELKSMGDQVTNLATRVADGEKAARKAEMTATLDRLSRGGFITKPQREFALTTWGEADENGMKNFNAWAGSCTTQIVEPEKVHGTGEDVVPPKNDAAAATARIMELSEKIAKEKGLPIRDAIIAASAQLPADAEIYRESFAPAGLVVARSA